MSTTLTPTDQPGRPSGARVAVHAEHAVQRVADASVWLIFRLSGVRSRP